jgi:hypothetical protein
MPRNYTTGASTNRTTDVRFPLKSDGTRDMRYVNPQFVNANGVRDMRTLLTSQRK